MPIQPISLKNHLARNPNLPPKYWVEVPLINGDRIKVADPRATRAMVALMDMEAVIGGAASHWGGPAAFAELMSAVFGYVFHISERNNIDWFEKFNLINDAGHCENGLYALRANYGFAGLTFQDLRKFRSIESKLTGHGESHLFPEAILLSNGPLGSSIPQAQGLAYADYLSQKKRVTICAISDGASFEGEAKEAFAAIPGFATKEKLAPFVCIVSDNNTKLSGRIDADSFSMSPQFAAMKALGWKVIPIGNGHDLAACMAAVEQAILSVLDDPKTPVCIHAKTIKGFGVEKTVKSSTGGHGFPLSNPEDLTAFLSEIYGHSEVPEEFRNWCQNIRTKYAAKPPSIASTSSEAIPAEKIQTGIAKAMIAKKKAGLPIISVTSDLPGSTGVAAFHKEFPESGVDVGVAEANMVSMAVGLSKAGYIPVVDTFAQFGVTKGALPMIMGALSGAPMIAVYSHTGFQDAADGASHQALSYISMTCSIPNVDVYCLTCSDEAESLMSQVLEEFFQARRLGQVPHSTIFFLGRENFPKRFLDGGHKYQLKKAQVISDNTNDFKKSVTIVAGGSILPQAVKAAENLKTKGVGCIVVNPAIINYPDVATLAACLEKTSGKILTVEDHQVIGGMGALIAHALLQNGVKISQMKSLGVRDQFGQSAYKASELYAKHGIDAKAIEAAALS
ncbi:MAG: transketolase C-terminal domain-containing protein [Pseudomonadota bacterium]|nr:transketolase C-terminal domain-containing protein [Pseudomonadota bacterium]